jgi:hypothetical protein
MSEQVQNCSCSYCNPRPYFKLPISVLVDICRAIDGDDRASGKAAETFIKVDHQLSADLGVVIAQLEDKAVRLWARNELSTRRIEADDHDSD